jgi:hypothetical protein
MLFVVVGLLFRFALSVHPFEAPRKIEIHGDCAVVTGDVACLTVSVI